MQSLIPENGNLKNLKRMFVKFQLVLLLTTFSAYSQNLIPNSSFEEVNYEFCGLSSVGSFEAAIKHWNAPTSYSPYIFSRTADISCTNHISDENFIQPKSGDRIAMICLASKNDMRSYLQVQLIEELIPNKKYYTEIWVQAYDTTVVSSIGFYFTDTLVKDRSIVDTVHFENFKMLSEIPKFSVLKFSPHINHSDVEFFKGKWTCLRSEFIAEFSAKYLLIGNFNYSQAEIQSNTVFIFVDDIYVGPQR
jgi:hypothetical protein